jgi:hypothetical protein
MLSFLPRWRGIAIALLSAIVLFGVVVGSPPVLFVTVRGGLSDTEWVKIPVTGGTVLEVGYLHSMYGVKQKEVFTVEPSGVFHLEKVLFGSLAAALYYDTDPPSGLEREDDVWAIRGEGKRFPLLKYRVSPRTGHALKIGERTIDLSSSPATAEGLVLITAEKTNGLFHRLKRFRGHSQKISGPPRIGARLGREWFASLARETKME